VNQRLKFRRSRWKTFSIDTFAQLIVDGQIPLRIQRYGPDGIAVFIRSTFREELNVVAAIVADGKDLSLGRGKNMILDRPFHDFKIIAVAIPAPGVRCA
jgi:hypothetical protein